MENSELQRIDYQWFLENMPSIYNEHGKKIAVIKNKIILGTFIIQKIYENKSKMEAISSGYMYQGIF